MKTVIEGYEGIPRYCYKEGIRVGGNCRMCIVEIGGKVTVACAAVYVEGEEVRLDTARVKKAREGVMEALLRNHPLDCAVCDEGGECELQEQAREEGADRGRMMEGRRGVEEKELGELIGTAMTRCISCTRCVRYGSEIGGEEKLGIGGRKGEIIGEGIKIGNVSGNVIELCPVSRRG